VSNTPVVGHLDTFHPTQVNFYYGMNIAPLVSAHGNRRATPTLNLMWIFFLAIEDHPILSS
jgi:hypothetical protein